MTLKLTHYTDIGQFNKKAHSFLIENEAVNSLPLGLLNGIQTTDRYKNPLLLLAENEESQEVVGVFIMTPPHYLVCSLQAAKEQFPVLAEKLKEFCEKTDISFPGFIAEKEAALELTKSWCRLTGVNYKIRMKQRIYKLTKVNDISLPKGEMVQAKNGDESIIAEWLKGFIKETNESPLTNQSAKQKALEMIEKEKSVFFWLVDGEPVSMARSARRTDNGITVNMVYTPKEFRKKGYASAIVSELSLLLLNNYSFCSLYTDLDNPTSNKIYMEIGYKPVCDSLMITIG